MGAKQTKILFVKENNIINSYHGISFNTIYLIDKIIQFNSQSFKIISIENFEIKSIPESFFYEYLDHTINPLKFRNYNLQILEFPFSTGINSFFTLLNYHQINYTLIDTVQFLKLEKI
jgi:hypothetical protein